MYVLRSQERVILVTGSFISGICFQSFYSVKIIAVIKAVSAEFYAVVQKEYVLSRAVVIYAAEVFHLFIKPNSFEESLLVEAVSFEKGV